MGQKGVPAEGGSGRKKGGTAKVDDPGQLLMAAALECITSGERCTQLCFGLTFPATLWSLLGVTFYSESEITFFQPPF